MTRNIGLSLREKIAEAALADVVLFFVELTHANMEQPIRLVSDGVDYMCGGKLWTGIPFDITILSDGEQVPRGEITVQNVDRLIGESILDVVGEVRVTIEIRTSADFDLDTDPREEIETSIVHYRAPLLYLTGVTIDSMSVTGELRSWDFTQESYPAMSATKDRLPGLYI